METNPVHGESLVVSGDHQPRHHDEGLCSPPIAAPHAEEQVKVGEVADSAIKSTVRVLSPNPMGHPRLPTTELCGRSGYHSRLGFAPRNARGEMAQPKLSNHPRKASFDPFF